MKVSLASFQVWLLPVENLTDTHLARAKAMLNNFDAVIPLMDGWEEEWRSILGRHLSKKCASGQIVSTVAYLRNKGIATARKTEDAQRFTAAFLERLARANALDEALYAYAVERYKQQRQLQV